VPDTVERLFGRWDFVAGFVLALSPAQSLLVAELIVIHFDEGEVLHELFLIGKSEAAHGFELVAQGEDVLGAGLVDGSLEGGLSIEPMVDRGSMQAGGSGGRGDGGALSQGKDDLRLDRRASKALNFVTELLTYPRKA